MKVIVLGPGCYAFEPNCENDRIANITEEKLREMGVSEKSIEIFLRYKNNINKPKKENEC
jgi:hypothetical protein